MGINVFARQIIKYLLGLVWLITSFSCPEFHFEEIDIKIKGINE
uniref:Uncharacterized protein n=1 Tax=Rhizophora mucronata TaxID=61149 RepID=A0A2P2KMW1_RHIMU